MSHSQFHLNVAVLRHAWLNLWDKHMTTGRINQITIRNSVGPRILLPDTLVELNSINQFEQSNSTTDSISNPFVTTVTSREQSSHGEWSRPRRSTTRPTRVLQQTHWAVAVRNAGEPTVSATRCCALPLESRARLTRLYLSFLPHIDTASAHRVFRVTALQVKPNE